MIAVDSNILVYAHREDAHWHGAAYECVMRLAEGRAPWAIPWPCIHEFLSIVTHARIYTPPTPLTTALDQVAAWLESPSLVLLTESDSHWEQLSAMLQTGRISGPLVHDARIAALCRQHGITELWTADRDFGRFPDIKARNPLVA